jgi:hypothetical protein
MNLILCSLRVVSELANCKRGILSFVSRLHDFLKYFTMEQKYIFLNEYSMPFSEHSLRMNCSLSAPPVLVYNCNVCLFYPYIQNISLSNMLTTYKLMNLPILSLELINSDNRCVRDLTSFIENIKYVLVPNKCIPTILDIIALWSTMYSTPVDRSLIRVRYITDEGDERIVSVQDTGPFGENVQPDPSNSDSEPK